MRKYMAKRFRFCMPCLRTPPRHSFRCTWCFYRRQRQVDTAHSSENHSIREKYQQIPTATQSDYPAVGPKSINSYGTNFLMSSRARGHSAKHTSGKIPQVQCAFKILMIHEVLQFALRIAFRCVLHRCGNLDIRC
jgi:hypothetical protein